MKSFQLLTKEYIKKNVAAIQFVVSHVAVFVPAAFAVIVGVVKRKN